MKKLIAWFILLLGVAGFLLQSYDFSEPSGHTYHQKEELTHQIEYEGVFFEVIASDQDSKTPLLSINASPENQAALARLRAELEGDGWLLNTVDSSFTETYFLIYGVELEEFFGRF